MRLAVNMKGVKDVLRVCSCDENRIYVWFLFQAVAQMSSCACFCSSIELWASVAQMGSCASLAQLSSWSSLAQMSSCAFAAPLSSCACLAFAGCFCLFGMLGEFVALSPMKTLWLEACLKGLMCSQSCS